MNTNRIPSIDEEAAYWLVRLNSDQCTRADEAAFREWLANDPVRADAYADHQALWSRIGALSQNDEARILLLADLPSAPRSRTRRNAILGGVGGAVAAALGIGWLENGIDHYRTVPGEQKTIHLGDGSTVILNTSSELRVDLQKAERRLYLDRGQAFFQVAKDKVRPFRVFVGNYEVRALGTAFDVRRMGDAAHVTLEEGKVAIYASNNDKPIQTMAKSKAELASSIVLHPGQQAVLAVAEPPTVTQIDLRRVEAWRYGEIVLDQTPLGDIVADLNRYGGPQIVLADTKLADIRISGVFHTGRPDVFVEAMTAAFPVRVLEHTPDRIVLASR